jgi:hypothetical protein
MKFSLNPAGRNGWTTLTLPPIRKTAPSPRLRARCSVDFLTNDTTPCAYSRPFRGTCHPERSVPTFFPAEIVPSRFPRRDAESKDLSLRQPKEWDVNKARACLIVSVSRLGLPVSHSKQTTEIISNRRELGGNCNNSQFPVTPSNSSTSEKLAVFVLTKYSPQAWLAAEKFDSLGRALLASPGRGGVCCARWQ